MTGQGDTHVFFHSYKMGDVVNEPTSDLHQLFFGRDPVYRRYAYIQQPQAATATAQAAAATAAAMTVPALGIAAVYSSTAAAADSRIHTIR